MTYGYQVFPERHFIYHKFGGQIVLPKLMATIEGMHQKLPELAQLKALIDLSEAELTLSFEEVKKLSDYARDRYQHISHPRVLLISEEVCTAIGILFVNKLNCSNFSVVSSLEGAESRLDLDCHQLELQAELHPVD